MTAQETKGLQQMRPDVGAMSSEGGAEVGLIIQHWQPFFVGLPSKTICWIIWLGDNSGESKAPTLQKSTRQITFLFG